MTREDSKIYMDLIMQVKNILEPTECDIIRAGVIYFSFRYYNTQFILDCSSDGCNLIYDNKGLVLVNIHKGRTRDMLDSLVNKVVAVEKGAESVYSAVKLVNDKDTLLGYAVMYKGLYCIIDLQEPCFETVSNRYREMQNNRSIRRTLSAICENSLEIPSIKEYYLSINKKLNVSMVKNEKMLDGIIHGISKRDRISGR